MTPSHNLYRAGTMFVSLLYPLIKMIGRHRKDFTESLDQRFGYYSAAIMGKRIGRPRIWFHAASVGEVSVAGTICRELKKMLPQADIILSTTTTTGQAYAASVFDPHATRLYAPVDAPAAVERALTAFCPDAMVFVETELWPNWTARAVRMNIPVILVNGRISPRSMTRYMKIKSLTRTTLAGFERLSMIHSEDAGRILEMGAEKSQIRVHGNAKFDQMVVSETARAVSKTRIRKLYHVAETDVVFVAGSTRQDEPEIVMDAWLAVLKKHPQALLFVAPRHIERAGDLAAAAAARGLDCQLRTGFDSNMTKRRAGVVIVDTIGELADLYGISACCFCGGSLAPLGGQNVLEPVSWGKPVFYGPHMQDFQEARDIIEKAVGDALRVENGRELAEKVIHVLDHPEYGKQVGGQARKAVLQNTGAAGKHAEEIINILKLRP